jgi:hypothetical protein
MRVTPPASWARMTEPRVKWALTLNSFKMIVHGLSMNLKVSKCDDGATGQLASLPYGVLGTWVEADSPGPTGGPVERGSATVLRVRHFAPLMIRSEAVGTT